MKFRIVAPVLGMVFLTACGGGAGSGRSAAPAIPSVAAFKSLDDVDQAFMTEHFNKAMESTLTGQSSSWTNPSGGYQVQVAPTRTFQQANSTYCREFTQSITSRDQPMTTRGTACRQSDGSWQIIG